MSKLVFAGRLERGFAALYAALCLPRAARRCLLALLAIHSSLLAYSAYVHSPTLNEPGHLVAGLSFWKFGRFDLYRNNPPLVRMVAALPVMAAGYEEDWSGFYEGPGAQPAFGMGEDFVKANGERTFFLMMIARWACIPFGWIGAITCFLWARDLYGRPAGVLAATIWCFEPNILAHASLITSDAAGTALGVAACYTFWRWLRRPTWTQAALTGVVLGLAELCKSTLIVFYPLWPAMWLVFRWRDRQSMTGRDWLREAGMLALRMIVGLYVLNLGYGFEGSFKPLKEFVFVSDPLAHSSNRFAGTWLGELPMPFPNHYILGLDEQQKSFEHWGGSAYLRGEWRDTGWWYYYLYAAAIKVPLALWLMGGLALAYRLFDRRSVPLADNTLSVEGKVPSPTGGGQGRGSFRDEFILLFPGLFIFAFVSSQTGINEHFRYALPAFPYFFIAISQITQLAHSSGFSPPNVLIDLEPQFHSLPKR
ncbi:MAG: glycosyltransferase family 39 protein [Pirellulales bacterium]